MECAFRHNAQIFFVISLQMDALQEACLTLDILASPSEPQLLQQRHLMRGKKSGHSTAPPSEPSSRETEKDGSKRDKVTAKSILSDAVKMFHNRRGTN